MVATDGRHSKPAPRSLADPLDVGVCEPDVSMFGLVTFLGRGALAMAVSMALRDTALLLALALVAVACGNERRSADAAAAPA